MSWVATFYILSQLVTVAAPPVRPSVPAGPEQLACGTYRLQGRFVSERTDKTPLLENGQRRSGILLFPDSTREFRVLIRKPMDLKAEVYDQRLVKAKVRIGRGPAKGEPSEAAQAEIEGIAAPSATMERPIELLSSEPCVAK